MITEATSLTEQQLIPTPVGPRGRRRPVPEIRLAAMRPAMRLEKVKPLNGRWWQHQVRSWPTAARLAVLPTRWTAAPMAAQRVGTTAAPPNRR